MLHFLVISWPMLSLSRSLSLPKQYYAWLAGRFYNLKWYNVLSQKLICM